MIEIFSSRKMIGTTIGLIVVCLVIIILEGIMTDDENSKQPAPQPENNNGIHLMEHDVHAVLDTPKQENRTPALSDKASKTKDKCWLDEEFKVSKACFRCSEFERKGAKSPCRETGFKEELRCDKTGLTFRSCEFSSSRFWTFELWMVALSVIFYYVTNIRKDSLQSKMIDKINKQIASGV